MFIIESSISPRTVRKIKAHMAEAKLASGPTVWRTPVFYPRWWPSWISCPTWVCVRFGAK